MFDGFLVVIDEFLELLLPEGCEHTREHFGLPNLHVGDLLEEDDIVNLRAEILRRGDFEVLAVADDLTHLHECEIHLLFLKLLQNSICKLLGQTDAVRVELLV